MFPLIVRWPGHVPAEGVDERSVLNIVDLVPSLCRFCGAEMPDGYKPDGEDITDALQGREFKRKKPQFWHYPMASGSTPTLAIRDGCWKLLTYPDGRRMELYNLSSDIGELKNLAVKQPDVVETLKRKLFAWYREAGLESVQPLGSD